MRRVTVRGSFKASQTVTACGSVRRRIGPARISGNAENRSANGVQDMMGYLLRGIHDDTRSFTRILSRRCLPVSVSKVIPAPVTTNNHTRDIFEPKRGSFQRFISSASVPSEKSEGRSIGCIISLLLTDYYSSGRFC